MVAEIPMQDTRIHYLYRITNIVSRKTYIGQSVDTVRRWYEHKRAAKDENSSMLISRAIKKYGNDAFEFEMIAGCKTWADANDMETLLVQQYNSQVPNGYNIAPGGINAPKTEEWKAAMSAIKGGWIGREHTDENLEKNRQAHLGIIVSEETKKKQSVAMKKKVEEGWMPKTIFTPGSQATKYWKGKRNTNGFKPGRVLDPEIENKRLSALRAKGAWNKTALSREQINEVVKLSSDGNSVRKISVITGLNRPLISKLLKAKFSKEV